MSDTSTANPIGTFDPNMLATLSPETKASFSDMMVKAGYDRAAVEARLDPKPPEEQHVFPEALSPEQQLAASVDRVFGAPQSALDYNIQLPAFMLEDDPKDASEFLADLKDGFFAAGVPAAMANSMFQTFAAAIERLPEGDAREAYMAEQSRRSKAVAGAKVDEMARFANLGQQALGKAGEELAEYGAFTTPEALVALAQFGRVVEARGKR